MGSMPHSGMPGPPCGAGVAWDHDVFRRHVQVFVVHRGLHAGVVVEDTSAGGGVLQELAAQALGLVTQPSGAILPAPLTNAPSS